MAWSEWLLFEKKNLGALGLPECDGVYEIRVSQSFPRLKGISKVVNIGRTDRGRNLRRRIIGKADYENFPGAMKWLQDGAQETFEIRYLDLDSQEEAKLAEDVRISQYLMSHWELPPGNGQGPGTDPTSVRRLITSNPSMVQKLGTSG